MVAMSMYCYGIRCTVRIFIYCLGATGTSTVVVLLRIRCSSENDKVLLLMPVAKAALQYYNTILPATISALVRSYVLLQIIS